MPRWANARNALAAGALLLFAAAVGADFRAIEIRPRLAGESLELSGQIELGLTAKVEEALAKGIPLEILIEVRLYRERGWWWNSKIGDWKLKREIRYHALSGQYLVKLSEARDAIPESHTSLTEAMRALGNLSELRLALDAPPETSAVHVARVRASLDIEALPAPLRPVAYTSLAWHLNSGWGTWNVTP
jgi:hypothetical protein